MARTTIMLQSTKTKNRNSRKNEKKRKSKKKRNTQTTKTKKRGITRRRIVGGADPASSSSSSSSSSLKRPRSAGKLGEQKRRATAQDEAAYEAGLNHPLPDGSKFDNTFDLQFDSHRVTIGIADSTIESAGKGIFNAGDNVIPKNRKICEYKGDVYLAGTIPPDIMLSSNRIFGNATHEIVGFDGDINDYGTLGTYANDILHDDSYNAAIRMTKNKEFYVISLKEIQPRQEIFVSYGKVFWEEHLKKNPKPVEYDPEWWNLFEKIKLMHSDLALYGEDDDDSGKNEER